MSVRLDPESPAFLADVNRIWLVGCGAMGGALLARWRLAGLEDSRLVVVDPAPSGLPDGFAGAVVATPAEAMAWSGAPDLVVLGVKPQLAGAVAEAVQAAVSSPFLLVSMLAGVRTATLASLLPMARVARIMPNMPARAGAGMTALFVPGSDPTDRAIVEQLMAPAGPSIWLEDEQRFDAVTSLSGSGPAFLFRFVEALAGAGESAGLDADTAAALARQTIIGAAALLEQSGESPAALRAAVTSPNGTTQAGLDVLDGDGALSSLVRLTVRAAAERSRALAAAADAALADAQVPPRREAARA